MRLLKKSLCILLVCVMLTSQLSSLAYENTYASNDSYTYNDWVSSLSDCWNPHTYETSDQSYPLDFLTLGFYSFYFNDELHPVAGMESYEGYVIVPEMAAAMPVDVTAQVKTEHPEFGIPWDANYGYAYTIDLNPNACWEDGTPITADDYVESMKRLLDPNLQNYRAGDYYEGSFSIAGAEAYAKAGTTVMEDNGATGTYAIADFTKGSDGIYRTPTGSIVYIAVDFPISWCNGDSLADYINAYGDAYFGMDTWDELYAMIDERGLVPLTDESLALLTPVTTSNPAWGETERDLPNYLVYEKTYPYVDYSTVGLYKSGTYQITLVLNKSLAGFNLLYNMSSNWLVKCDLYDACLREEVTASGSVWTSTYCTSVETTCSYGPYKMTSYQTDKGMHFAKNENWYGYHDGQHFFVDPDNGQAYSMYQTTDIDCQVVDEVATAKMMFLKGELMTYGLQTEDFDAYRNSPYAYFTPGQATYFLMLNGNMDTIRQRESAAGFDRAAYDLETLTLTSFHRAITLSFDRELYCEIFSPAQSPAFGLLGSSYIADPTTGLKYRDTDEAKQVLVDVYGLDLSQFASVDEAIASITGYDPVAAKEWYFRAYEEALAAGFISDENGDGICDQTIELTYSASSVSDKLRGILNWMTQNANIAAAGTPFEGKISIVVSAPLGNDWSYHLKAGLTDFCLCGWNGSAMDPFGLIEVYTNPSYQYDAQWFDSTTVDMTLYINDQYITMNLNEWTQALNGMNIYRNGRKYNFGDGIAPQDVRIQILAAIEKEVLLHYNYLPFTEEGSLALLSKKAYYVIDDYNPVMGRGGIQYLRYYYNDYEWNAYVASCGGTLDYMLDDSPAPGGTVLNGLQLQNGIFWYYINGEVQHNFTGLVFHTDGNHYYVESGRINFDYIGLVYFKNDFYYVQNGVFNDGYTGLVEFFGSWYYVEDGILNFSYTGLTYFNGVFFYVKNGALDTSYTGLVEFFDSWYYVENGVLNFGYTGLAYSHGNFYNISYGVLNTGYTGLVEFFGTWYYVDRGVLDFAYTGLTYFNGAFFYVENGTLNTGFTGLVEFFGNWYYVENGVLNFNYTGLVYWGGNFFYVENGALNTGFTGLVEFYGTWYYVENGVINFSYTGTIFFNGTYFTVVNGVVRF